MSSYIYRPDFVNLYYIFKMADDDVWNIEHVPKTEKRCCVFKDCY